MRGAALSGRLFLFADIKRKVHGQDGQICAALLYNLQEK
jgi:hypothetical protein